MKLNGNELDIRLFILNQLYKNSRKDFSNSKYFKGIKRRNHKFRRKTIDFI